MSGHSARPILPAPPSPARRELQQQASQHDIVSTHRLRPLPKRSQITAVACQPCQQRKSKCDGGRPVCSACIAKRRPDCVYDAAGDQRRTTALKKKIQHLEQQTGDLKDVIASLMSVSGRVDAHALVQKLQLDGFQGLEAVAEQLRAHGYSSSASTPTSTDVALEPGLQMLFQGADAACPVAAEFQGLRVVLPPWMLPMSPTYTDPGLPSDSDWTQSGCEG